MVEPTDELRALRATTDSTLRGLTEDGGFRVMTARVTDTVRGIVEAQDLKGEQARVFGEMLVCSVLFRETMSPGLRVQGIFKAESGTLLVADSAPEGKTRGLVQRRSEGDLRGFV